MSIVSGLATATGVSSLLNARRGLEAPFRVLAGEFSVAGLSDSGSQGNRRSSAGAQTLRPVVAPDDTEAMQSQMRRHSADPRYVQFVDAVTALRVDLSEVNLTEERVAELRAAAKAVFRLDGLPEDRSPDPVEVTAQANRDRAEQARQARARDAEEVRVETAERLKEARARDAERVARTAESEAVHTTRPDTMEQAYAQSTPFQERPYPEPLPDVPESVSDSPAVKGDSPAAGAKPSAIPERPTEPAAREVNATPAADAPEPAKPEVRQAEPA